MGARHLIEGSVAMSAVERLRDMRRAGVNDPDSVLALAGMLGIDEGLARLGEEAWAIYEQVFYAAVVASKISVASVTQPCPMIGTDEKQLMAKRMTDKFGLTDRTLAMQGMLAEARGDTTAALEFYDQVLGEEGSNTAVWKRRIAMERARGNVSQAVAMLVEYLDTVYSDPEAWAELADMYGQLGLLDRQLFCLQELVLMSPHSYELHAQLSECLYRQANASNRSSGPAIYVDMLHHACRSVELCRGYLRGFIALKHAAVGLRAEAGDKSVTRKKPAPAGPIPSAESLEALEALADRELKLELLNPSLDAGVKLAIQQALGEQPKA